MQTLYGDITKDEKEKCQYQDTICSDAEEGNGEKSGAVRLRNRSSHFKAMRGELWGVSTHGKTFPLAFLELMTAGKHPSALTNTILCHLAIFATLL